MPESHFPTAPRTAAAVSDALRDDNVGLADRIITELFGRIINATVDIPARVLEEPGTTGDRRYDTLLATGMAYALATRGLPAEPWMDAVPALDQEWLWDGDDVASAEFRVRIRRQTPPLFLAKGLLLRDKDMRIA